MNAKILAVAVTVCLLTACASNPDKIDAAYVSPLKYQNYGCDQIALEMDYVGQRTTKLYTRLKKERNKDTAQMGVDWCFSGRHYFSLRAGTGLRLPSTHNLKASLKHCAKIRSKGNVGSNRSRQTI